MVSHLFSTDHVLIKFKLKQIITEEPAILFLPTLRKSWNPTRCPTPIHCITIISALHPSGSTFNGWIWLSSLFTLKSRKPSIYIQRMGGWMDDSCLIGQMGRSVRKRPIFLLCSNFCKLHPVYDSMWKNCKKNMI